MRTVSPERAALIADYIRAHWHYHPITGQIKGRSGRVIGSKNNGALVAPVYLFDGTKTTVLLHRAAWLLMTGDWPPITIDHEDGNRTRNVWTNLRPATRSEQRQNLAGVTAKGRLRGVTPYYRKWKAQIKKPGDRAPTYLGLFGTEAEAHSAYCEAKARLHPFNPQQR